MAKADNQLFDVRCKTMSGCQLLMKIPKELRRLIHNSIILLDLLLDCIREGIYLTARCFLSWLCHP